MNREEKKSRVDFTIDDRLDHGSTMILEEEAVGYLMIRAVRWSVRRQLIDDTALS